MICEYYIFAVQTSSGIKRNQRDLQTVTSFCLRKTVVLRTSCSLTVDELISFTLEVGGVPSVAAVMRISSPHNPSSFNVLI